MNSETVYIVEFRWRQDHCYLLWRDGGSGSDEYVTHPNSSAILAAKTQDDLLHLAQANGLDVSRREAQSIDLEAMLQALERLRPSNPLSRRTCEFLLECWNALEDLARTLKMEFFSTDVDVRQTNAICRKLFEGNNLASVSSGDLAYHAQFSSSELRVLRVVLREAVKGMLPKLAAI